MNKKYLPSSINKSSLRRYRVVWMVLAILLFIIAVGFAWAHLNKNKIVNAAIDGINRNLKGTVAIRDVDFTLFERFPNISIRLDDVSITDSFINSHHDTLFFAKEISLQLKMIALFTGSVAFHSVKMSDARISLRSGSEGNGNMELMKTSAPSNSKNSRISYSLDKVFLRNVSFNFTDSAKGKHFSFAVRESVCKIQQQDSLYYMDVEGRIHFNDLTFNIARGGYLTNQEVQLNAKAAIDPSSKEIRIHSGKLRIQKESFNLTGTFNLSDTKKMLLDIYSVSATTNVVYSVLPQSISEKISKYALEKPLMLKAHINGSLKAGSLPAVDIFFQTNSNRMTVGNQTFDSVKLLGWFNNHIDSLKISDDANTKIFFPVFNARANYLPLKLKMVITDLKNPKLFMNARIHLDASSEQKELDPDRFEVISGKTDIHFDFNGPLINYLDTANGKMNADLKGKVEVKDFGINYLPTGYQFRNVNMTIPFDENDIYIDTINMMLNGNSIGIGGKIENFISFIFLPDVKANALLSVNADTMNFNTFKPPALVADSLKKIQGKEEHKTTSKSKIASTVDRIIEKLELDLDLTSNRIVIKKFVATDITGRVTIANDHFRIQHLTMNTGGGTISMDGSVSQLDRSTHPMSFHASMTNADISSIMYSFDNFGQNGVTHNNIDGKVAATVDFSASLSRYYKVIGSTMLGDLSLKITKGKLKDFESLSQISKYIFKNRDFTNIDFSEVNNEYELMGSEMTINKLEVYSSVLTLFAEGRYDLNQANTDLVIQVPFSNFKKKHVEELLVSRDSSAKEGNSIYLRATNGKDGKVLIAPVIFGKKKNIVRDAIPPEENENTTVKKKKSN